jgi:hypothetical protein
VLSVYDINSALLKTSVEFDRVGKRLFVKTNPETEHFIRLKPDLAKCWDRKGQLYFEAKRWSYGSEASHEFNALLDTTLCDLGFRPSRGDRCLYTPRAKDGKFTIVSTHVDDLMVTSPTPKDRDDFERDLKKHFEMNADEIPYLGMNQNDEITVNQEGYTKDLLKKFLGKEQMRKPLPTPANVDVLEHDGKDPPCDRTEYLSKVMALMHLAIESQSSIKESQSWLQGVRHPTLVTWVMSCVYSDSSPGQSSGDTDSERGKALT